MRATESNIKITAFTVSGDEIDLTPNVLRYNDQHPIGAVASFSLALAPRIGITPLTEIIDNGDLLEVGLISTDGRTGPHGVGAYQTVTVGVIRSIGLRQNVNVSSLDQVLLVSGNSIAGFLLNDTINYQLAYGSLVGFFKSLGLAPIDAYAMRGLDEALSTFMSKVAYNILRVERPIGKIKDLLGYAFESVAGQGLFDTLWGNYEGQLWSFLQSASEEPLHEIYTLTIPKTRVVSMTGFQNIPSTTFGPDEAMNIVRIRPAPFPHGIITSGTPTTDLSAWHALPLHDLTDPTWFLDSAQDEVTTRGDQDVKNFFLLYPKTLQLDEVMQITFVPPVTNDKSWKKFGYRPLSFATNLWGRDADKEGALEYFRQLNWRLAGQWNKADQYFSGNLDIRLAPHIRPGERVRVNNIMGDDTTTFEYYVMSVRHTFDVTGARITALQLERGLPEATYQDPAYFVGDYRELPPVRDAALSIPLIRSYDQPGPQ